MGRSYRAVAAILGRIRPSLRGGLAVRVAQIAGLAALAGAASGLLPAVMGVALDALLGRPSHAPGGAAALFARAAHGTPAAAVLAAAAIAVLLTVAVSVGSSRRASEITGEVTAALRVELLRAVLHASPRAVEEAGRAAIASRPAPPGSRPAPAVRGAEIVKLSIARESAVTAEFLVSLLGGIPQAVVTLAVVLWDLVAGGAAVVLVGAVVLFALSRIAADRASRRVGRALTELSAADAAIFAALGETLAATEDLRLLGARGEAVADFARAAYRTADARRRFASALAVSGQIKSVFTAASPLLLLVAFSVSGRAEPGEVARLLLVIPLLMARLEALDALRGALVEREPLLTSAARLLALPASPPAAPDAVGIDAVPSGAVTFEDVRVHPEGAAAPLLDGLSLSIPAGAVVGICGRSGSGKSTLVRALLRLDEIDGGAVRLDGTDLRRIDPAALPRVFAVLGQASRLFERGVGDNLAIGLDPRPDPARLVEALDSVDLGEVAARGLDAEIRLVPPNLSGGEQRRLLLARLLLRDARILVLDEPEQGLPGATAEALLAQITAVAAGRTTLVVTHAPHLLRSTFNIVIDGGRVAAQGTHEELLARSEIYRSLLAEGLKRAAPDPAPPGSPPDRR